MNWLLNRKSAGKTAAPSSTAAGGRVAGEVNGAALANGCLRLEISAETLLRLLANGQLCAADFRCLDCESKQCIWRLLLMSCKTMLKPGSGCNGCCSECGKVKAGAEKEQEQSIPIAKKFPAAASALIRIHGNRYPLLTK
jgi:hypothetical protein